MDCMSNRIALITYAIAGENIKIRRVNILTKPCDTLGFVYFKEASKSERVTNVDPFTPT